MKDKMVCLETTFLIDLLRGKPEVKSIKDELDRTGAFFTVATPSVIELWSGALQSNQPAREQEKINRLLASVILLSLDGKSAKEAGEIEAELVKKGLEIQPEDVMIAGIARVNGEKLVTRDADYTRIPGLTVLKY